MNSFKARVREFIPPGTYKQLESHGITYSTEFITWSTWNLQVRLDSFTIRIFQLQEQLLRQQYCAMQCSVLQVQLQGGRYHVLIYTVKMTGSLLYKILTNNNLIIIILQFLQFVYVEYFTGILKSNSASFGMKRWKNLLHFNYPKPIQAV